MNSRFQPGCAAASDPMTPTEVDAVLGQARALQIAVGNGTMQGMLRGKNLGLLCESEDTPEALLFRRAARQLGGHVSYVQPSLSELSTPREVQRTARMLGRLYDAVECQGAAHALAPEIGAAAGVPVYGGLASPAHPTARLAALLGDDTSPEDNRCFVVQAVLLTTIT